MKILRLFDEVFGVLVSIGTGGYFESKFNIDNNSGTYELHISRSYGNISFNMRRRSKLGFSTDLCNFTYFKHCSPEEKASGFRIERKTDQEWDFAYLCLEPSTLYTVRYKSGSLTFCDDELEETHFQMSTIETVPDLELCKEVQQYRKEFDSFCDMECGYAIRGSVSEECDAEDTEFLLKMMKGTIGMM